MTLMPPTRKRSRSCEEEDCLPLSKKINNLHINNWGSSHQEQQSVKWNHSYDQYINHYSGDLSNGRQENECRDSSPFKSAQDNLQNGFSETDLNEHYKHLSEDSYKSSNYSLEKYTDGEGSSQESREQNWSNVYNPDLGIDENPYYYESNKLLFNLYLERLQRGGN